MIDQLKRLILVNHAQNATFNAIWTYTFERSGQNGYNSLNHLNGLVALMVEVTGAVYRATWIEGSTQLIGASANNLFAPSPS